MRGRKSKYDKETFPTLAEGYAREGMLDKDIATKLGVSLSTYHDYQLKFPEFSEALKRGKAPVDFEVEKSLLTLTQGFEYEEVTKIMALDKEGKPQLKETKVTKKKVIPNERAIEFWLRNRKPDQWRDKQYTEHSGQVLTGDIEVGYTDMNGD